MSPKETCISKFPMHFQRPKEASHSVIVTVMESALRSRGHLLRITGGMGKMNPWHACMLGKRIIAGFDGFTGPILFGGTRMVHKETGKVKFGVTEIPSAIKRRNSGVTLVGVAPKLSQPVVHKDYGIVICEEPDEDFITVAHPEQDRFVVLETNVDPTVVISREEAYSLWNEEWKECLRVALRVRTSGIKPLLFVFNGGDATEAELLAWIRNGLPCLIVKGSGRCADKYGLDDGWVKANPTIRVCEASADSIHKTLADLGVIDPQHVRASRFAA